MARFEFLGPLRPQPRRAHRRRADPVWWPSWLCWRRSSIPTDPLRIVGTPELWPGEDPDFPLGTDSLGRDILAMIVHGARATLLIGLFASAVATLIGVTVGAIAGYFGGWVDEVVMRAAELFQTIPNLIFVLTIVVILGSTLPTS